MRREIEILKKELKDLKEDWIRERNYRLRAENELKEWRGEIMELWVIGGSTTFHLNLNFSLLDWNRILLPATITDAY